MIAPDEPRPMAIDGRAEGDPHHETDAGQGVLLEEDLTNTAQHRSKRLGNGCVR